MGGPSCSLHKWIVQGRRNAPCVIPGGVCAESRNMGDQNRNDEFLRLFLPIERRLYAYIRTMVFNRADAEDILQEVAATLWRSFDNFEPGTHFDRWAIKAAFNQVRYFRQKHHRNVLAFSEPLLKQIAETAEEVSQHDDEFITALIACMDKLEPADRDMLQLWSQPHATAASIARQLGYSRSTASRTLNRIQRTLLWCIRSRLDEGAGK
jgi:RNA polymerase sigma-70 factor, ECF subfamily